MSVKASEIEILEKRIKEEVISQFRPNEKFMSERKLAHLLGSTHNKTHRAVKNLVTQGVLVTKIGDGTYLKGNQESNTTSINALAELEAGALNDSFFFNTRICQRLNVHIPVGGSTIQENFWSDLIGVYNQEYPFVKIVPDFTNTKSSADFDLLFMGTQQIYTNHVPLQTLDINLLSEYGFQARQLCDDILIPTTVSGANYGIPILRSSAALWANLDLLKRHDIKTGDLSEPAFVFQAANKIEEESNGDIIGANYMGFHWHSAHYGIEVVKTPSGLEIDWKLLRQFLNDFKPYMKKHYISIDAKKNMTESFFHGHMAFFTGYMHYHPVFQHSPHNLKLLKFPRKANGFSDEGLLVASLAKNCRNIEEASRFISFLVSEKAQRLLSQNAPNWQSVRKDVLNAQKEDAIFPAGSVSYDYDSRSNYSLSDHAIFHTFGPMLEVETGKFFLDHQDLETTITRIKKQGVEYVR